MSNMSTDDDGDSGGGGDTTGGGPLLSYLPSFTNKLFVEEDGLFHPLAIKAGSFFQDARVVVVEEIWPVVLRDFTQWKAGLWKELEAYENRREGNTKFQLVLTCLLVFGIAFHLELFRLWIWFTKKGGQWDQLCFHVRLYHQSLQRKRKRNQKLKQKNKQQPKTSSGGKQQQQSTSAQGGTPTLSNWIGGGGGGGVKNTLLSPTSTASTTVEDHTPTSSVKLNNNNNNNKDNDPNNFRPSGNRENIMLMMQNSHSRLSPRPTPDERPKVPRDAYGLKINNPQSQQLSPMRPGGGRRTASMDMRPAGSRYHGASCPAGRAGSRSPTRSTSMDLSGNNSSYSSSYRSTQHQSNNSSYSFANNTTTRTNNTIPSSKLLSESGTSFAGGSHDDLDLFLGGGDDTSYKTPNNNHGTTGTLTPTTTPDHSSHNDHHSSSTKNTNRSSRSRKSDRKKKSKKKDESDYEREQRRQLRKQRRRNTSPMRSEHQQPLLADEEKPMRRAHTMDTSSNHNPNTMTPNRRIRKLVGQAGSNTPLSLAEARNRRRMSEQRGSGGSGSRTASPGGPGGIQRTYTGGSGGRSRLLASSSGGEHGYAKQMHPRARSGNGAMTKSASQMYMARQPSAANAAGMRNSGGSGASGDRRGGGATSPVPSQSSSSYRQTTLSPKRGGDNSNSNNYATSSPYNNNRGPGPRMSRQPSRQELGYE